MSRVSRTLKIFNEQFRSLSFREMAALLKASLFKSQDIIIYARESNAGRVGVSYDKKKTIIKKGTTPVLETIRKDSSPLPWEFSCDIYDRVSDFFVTEYNGRVGHISWVYYRGDPNRLIDLKDDEAEIKYCLTLEAFRGRGLYPGTLVEIQKYLFGKGIKRVFICVDKDNIPSIRGIEKAGFKKAGAVRLIKFFGVQLNGRYSFKESIGNT